MESKSEILKNLWKSRLTSDDFEWNYSNSDLLQKLHRQFRETFYVHVDFLLLSCSWILRTWKWICTWKKKKETTFIGFTTIDYWITVLDMETFYLCVRKTLSYIIFFCLTFVLFSFAIHSKKNQKYGTVSPVRSIVTHITEACGFEP